MRRRSLRDRSAATAALRASGLPRYWAGNYPSLRTPEAAAAAEEHVVGTLATLPLPYRLAYTCALRTLPAAYRIVAGHRMARAADGAGMARLAALPGFAEVLRATTALALYGALDGRISISASTRTRTRTRPRTAA
ncbi:hypothetical protein OK074_2724 [Actinobacteria bacterium OK074]|nr:hypothetical protein OK074_2724 [Actinobacteria bacterium OK074]